MLVAVEGEGGKESQARVVDPDVEEGPDRARGRPPPKGSGSFLLPNMKRGLPGTLGVGSGGRCLGGDACAEGVEGVEEQVGGHPRQAPREHVLGFQREGSGWEVGGMRGGGHAGAQVQRPGGSACVGRAAAGGGGGRGRGGGGGEREGRRQGAQGMIT
jgi:hypothetical protein